MFEGLCLQPLDAAKTSRDSMSSWFKKTSEVLITSHFRKTYGHRILLYFRQNTSRMGKNEDVQGDWLHRDHYVTNVFSQRGDLYHDSRPVSTACLVASQKPNRYFYRESWKVMFSALQRWLCQKLEWVIV